MPKNDDLKDRLDELFSSIQPEEVAAQEAVAEAAPSVAKIFKPMVALPAPDFFEAAFENNAIGMVVTGTDARFIHVNSKFCELLGFSPLELEGLSFQDYTYEEDIDIGSDTLRAILAGDGDTANIQKRYIHKDGHLIWVDLNISLLRGENDEPLRFVTAVQDIGEQKDMSLMLAKRVKELNCLSDIGHKMDEKPPIADFIQWVIERIPQSFQYPDYCTVAIEYRDTLYGNPDAVELQSKIVGGLRISGELVGWLHVAYTEPRDFIDAESALLGGIVSRVSSYLESQILYEHTQSALEQANIFRQFAETSGQAFGISTMDGDIIYVNPGLARMAGVEAPEELVGQNFVSFYPPDLVQKLQEEALPIVMTEGEWTGELPLTGPHGQEIPTIWNLFLIRDDDGNPRYLANVMTDISDRKAAEEELTRRASELATVAEVSTTTAAALDPQELLQSVVELTKERFELYHAHVYLLNEAGDALELAAGAGEPGKQMVARGWEIPLESERSLVARAARERHGVIVNDVHADPGFLPNELLPDTASEMAVPLIAGDQVLGVLDVQSDDADHFSEEDVNIQTTLASQVAVALQNARQFERAQTALALADSLFQISHDVNEASNEEELLQTLAQPAFEAGANTATLMYLDLGQDGEPEWTEIVASTYLGDVESIVPVGSRYYLPELPISKLWIADPEEPLLISDIYNDERVDVNARALLEMAGSRAMTVVPMTRGGKHVAMIVFSWAEPHKYSSREIETYRGLIGLGSPAVHNRRLLQSTQDALSETETLYQISSAVGRTLELDEALTELLSRILLAMEYEGGLISVADPVTQELSLAVHENLPEGMINRLMEQGLEGTPCDLVFQLGRTVHVADLDQIPEYIEPWRHVFDGPKSIGFQSYLGVTLVSKGIKLGTVCVFNRSPKTLAPTRVDLLEAIGLQIGVLVENARLFEETQIRARQEQILRQITTSVRGSVDPDAILRTAVRELGDALGRKSFVRLGSAEQLARPMEANLGVENKTLGSNGRSGALEYAATTEGEP